MTDPCRGLSATPDAFLPLNERALREQYAASGLPSLGMSFEEALASPSISISLRCGVKAAELASRQQNANPHWTEKYLRR